MASVAQSSPQDGLERCIAQLSPDDGAELSLCKLLLRRPPAQQVEDCQQCCSRTKGRLEKAQETAKVAQEAVDRLKVELQEF